MFCARIPDSTPHSGGKQQESFLDALAHGFEFFGGVFSAVWFDNGPAAGHFLTTAVQKVLEGRNRREQRHFIGFRSHYL